MKNLLLLLLLINASLLVKGQVVITLNLPDPCSCDNTELNELLNVQNVTLPNATDTCFNATQTIVVGEVGAPFVMEQGASAEMIAGERIIFKPYTHIKAGSQLYAYIAPDGPFCNTPLKNSIINEGVSGNINDDELTPKDILFKLYPNPTTGILTIDLLETEQSSPTLIEVFDLTGKKRKMLRMYQTKQYAMNLTDLPPGMYIVSLRNDKFKSVEKIIKL